MKLDKYISKVQVITTSGTKEYTYDKEQLAKVEIKSKEIQGATIVVNYKLIVTNEGELPVTNVKVADYIPEGFNFTSEMNKNWTTNSNGEAVNTTNQSIKPGESMELELILTKTMTSNSTGTFTNKAEVREMKNSLGTEDIDSKPGNKIETEDDFSKADLIISVGTGALVYISGGIVLVALVTIVVFLSYKYGILKIGKISLLGLVITVTLIAGSDNVQAAAPSKAKFTWSPYSYGYYNNYGSRYFYGEEKTGNALCVQAGVGVAGAGSEYKFNRYTGSASYTEVDEEAENLKFDLTKVEEDKNKNPIQVEEQHPDGIAMKKLSTFKFKCSSTEAELKFYAYNYNKNTVYCKVESDSGIENNGSGKYNIKEEYKNKEIKFSIYVKEEDYEKRNCVY